MCRNVFFLLKSQAQVLVFTIASMNKNMLVQRFGSQIEIFSQELIYFEDLISTYNLLGAD